MKDPVWHGVREAVRKKLRIEHHEVTPSQICTYLSGSSEAPFDLNGGDTASIWSRIRKASKELAKRVKNFSWNWCETRK